MNLIYFQVGFLLLCLRAKPGTGCANAGGLQLIDAVNLVDHLPVFNVLKFVQALAAKGVSMHCNGRDFLINGMATCGAGSVKGGLIPLGPIHADRGSRAVGRVRDRNVVPFAFQ